MKPSRGRKPCFILVAWFGYQPVEDWITLKKHSATHSWKPNLVCYTDMWNMRFQTQGGKGNVNENVFTGIAEILVYTCDNSLLVQKISSVVSGSDGLVLVVAISQYLENKLWICPSDGLLQTSFVADNWDKTVKENRLFVKKERDAVVLQAMSLAMERERKNIYNSFQPEYESFWDSAHWRLL